MDTDRFSRLNSLYMLAALDTLCCGKLRVAHDDLALFISTLQGLVAEIASHDIIFDTKQSKRQFWSTLLSLPKNESPDGVKTWMENYDPTQMVNAAPATAADVAMEPAAAHSAGTAGTEGATAVIANVAAESEAPQTAVTEDKTVGAATGEEGKGKVMVWNGLNGEFRPLIDFQDQSEHASGFKKTFMKCLEAWINEKCFLGCGKLGRV